MTNLPSPHTIRIVFPKCYSLTSAEPAIDHYGVLRGSEHPDCDMVHSERLDSRAVFLCAPTQKT